MRKYLNIVCLLLSVMVFTGCKQENAKARLQMEVEAANNDCPIDLGMLGQVTSFNYDEDENQMEMIFEINGETINLDVFKSNDDIARNMMKLSFSQEEQKEMVNVMVDAGASMAITYLNPLTWDSYTVIINPSEMKEIQKSKLSDTEVAQLILENNLLMENSSCPTLIDEGMYMISATDDGDYIIYSYQLDEDLYDMDDFKGNQDVLKEVLSSALSDPGMSTVFSTFIKAGKGIKYRYIGETSGKYVDIVFTCEEIESALN